MDEFVHGMKASPSWYDVIDCKEPFILSIIFFQLFLTFICTTWHSETCQWLSFLFILLLLNGMEYLNEIGRLNWKNFASHNYFDGRGNFMALFMAGPLLMTGFCQVACTIQAI